jgi:RimJ/RimL family protein N-acetyltransferase
MIETERLSLVSATAEHFEAAIESHQKLAELLGASLAADWLVFPEAIPGGYAMLKADPLNIGWGTHFFVHKPDNKLVGSGGYCGAPDSSGMVEIGYAISPEYRGKGLATEASHGLIDHAFLMRSINMVDAHTLAEVNGSTHVLEKCGMTKIGEIKDTENGDIWHWRILRDEI